MPLTSEGELVDQTPTVSQIADAAQHAPPLYGDHILDQLYADVDQSGFMTPAPQSGMSTPFFAQSRAGSSENLPSLLADTPAHPAGAVPPAALSSRLQNLNLNAHSRNSSFLRRVPGSRSGADTPHSHPNSAPPHDVEGYFQNGQSGNASGHASTPLSRRVSNEEDDHHTNRTSNLTSGVHTPEHLDYSELGDLSKVPSYSTAVKTPVRGMSYNENLPNYQTAVSAPPSPDRRFSSLSNLNTPTNEQPPDLSHGSNHSSRNPLSTMGFTPINPPPMAYSNDSEERRRVLVMQGRDRH
jgi:hypothetical protein